MNYEPHETSQRRGAMLRVLRLYRLRCRSEMISESERKNHLGLISRSSQGRASSSVGSSNVDSSSDVAAGSVDESMLEAAALALAKLRVWLGACVACLTHITHTQRVTCCLNCCFSCILASFVTHLRQLAAATGPQQQQQRQHQFMLMTALPPQDACNYMYRTCLFDLQLKLKLKRRLHLPLVLCHS